MCVESFRKYRNCKKRRGLLWNQIIFLLWYSIIKFEICKRKERTKITYKNFLKCYLLTLFRVIRITMHQPSKTFPVIKKKVHKKAHIISPSYFLWWCYSWLEINFFMFISIIFSGFFPWWKCSSDSKTEFKFKRSNIFLCGCTFLREIFMEEWNW